MSKALMRQELSLAFKSIMALEWATPLWERGDHVVQSAPLFLSTLKQVFLGPQVTHDTALQLLALTQACRYVIIAAGCSSGLKLLLMYHELAHEFKGEFTFENDSLIEGGQLNEMTNETTFREVRQYRSGHHLVRFYFLTRVYSAYLESILSDFQSGPQPDVLIANSCVWDLNRYNDKHLEGYKTNLDHLFLRLKEVLSPPVPHHMDNDHAGRMTAVSRTPPHNLRKDIVEANLCSAILADFHQLDVLDMHYHFRYDLNLRCIDATHWNQEAHRKYTQILLTHIAVAWGVKMPKAKKLKGARPRHRSPLLPAPPHWFSFGNDPHPMPYPPIQEREHCSP
ncbi:unnamed protein product, partial [Ranitomeya imitator]